MTLIYELDLDIQKIHQQTKKNVPGKGIRKLESPRGHPDTLFASATLTLTIYELHTLEDVLTDQK